MFDLEFSLSELSLIRRGLVNLEFKYGQDRDSNIEEIENLLNKIATLRRREMKRLEEEKVE